MAGILRAPVADAHRSRVALTRVIADRSGRGWESITTLHLHDAGLALLRLTGDPSKDASTPDGQARLALELERGLRWVDPAGVPLHPVTEGAELLNNDLAIYQSLTPPDTAGDFTVESRFLRDVHPDITHTLQFDVVVPPRTARLTAAAPRARFAWAPLSAAPR